MDKYDSNGVEETKQENNDNDNTTVIGLIIAFIASNLGWAGYNFLTKRKLNKEREKNAQYQELIRKHQAEIDALKNDKERREYKERLWEAYQAEMEE